MKSNAQAPSPTLGRSITRKGKIAHLPHRVREALNERLLDGQDGTDILPWLNALPEVKERMAARHGGAKISAENLSQWRHGGYAEWLAAPRLSGRN